MVRIFLSPIRTNGHDDAYNLLRTAYRLCTGEEAPPVVKTQRGKPFFVDNAIEFSLAHSKRWVVCACSDLGPVGVDVEDERQVRDGLETRVLTPAEQVWLAAQPERDAALLTLWTRKEAWVKRTGQGLDGRPRAVETTSDSLTDAEFQTFRQNGCIVTVCTAPCEPAHLALL